MKLNDGLVDSIGMQLVLSPEKFDVIVTTNLFGDILSDVAAAEVGGLGLAPSLNSGEKYAMAQAVHGSAPDIAGQGVANPVAEILSTSMLLDWLHAKYGDDSLKKTALTIENAVHEVLSHGESEITHSRHGGKCNHSGIYLSSCQKNCKNLITFPFEIEWANGNIAPSDYLHIDGSSKTEIETNIRGQKPAICPLCNNEMAFIQTCHVRCNVCGTELSCEDKGWFWG